MGSRADRLNRVLLSLLGLLLLAAGTTGLLFGLGAFGEQRSQSQVLSGEAERVLLDPEWWLWPVVAVVLAVLGGLALCWLVLQLRTDRVGDLELTERRGEGETHVDAGAVTDALVDATEDVPGVERASARLVSRRGREQLVLTVRLADRADLASVRQQLADGPLTDLRRCLGEQASPDLRVELEPSPRGSARVLA